MWPDENKILILLNGYLGYCQIFITKGFKNRTLMV